MSSEALAGGLHRLDERLLAGLGELACRHRVRVAYYVRPQDAALEAHWRQWGFRSDQEPSRFVALRSRQLEYVATWTGVRERAPGVAFEVRPFRRDLLHSGDIVGDFAHHFLGVEQAVSPRSAAGAWDNQGLPLDVANALRAVPDGILWTHGHGNRRLDAVRRIVARLDLPESEAARRSRLVLRDYAHERFEIGNRRLISALGWPTDGFVAPRHGRALTARARRARGPRRAVAGRAGAGAPSRGHRIGASRSRTARSGRPELRRLALRAPAGRRRPPRALPLHLRDPPRPAGGGGPLGDAVHPGVAGRGGSLRGCAVRPRRRADRRRRPGPRAPNPERRQPGRASALAWPAPASTSAGSCRSTVTPCSRAWPAPGPAARPTSPSTTRRAARRSRPSSRPTWTAWASPRCSCRPRPRGSSG